MGLRFVLALAAAAAALLVSALPSSATVHEIVGQWCSGQPELEPRGISDPTKGNFARPLFASGVATFVPLFDGQNNLIQFDFDHPAAKIDSAGFNFLLGDAPPGQPDLYITAWTTDDDFAAFRNCPGYVGGGLP
jgi:hypothetical protein